MRFKLAASMISMLVVTGIARAEPVTCTAPILTSSGVADPGANSTPVTTADTYTVDQYQTYAIPVLANDTDPDGDTLQVTFVSGSTRGTALISVDKTKVDFTAGQSMCDGPGNTETLSVMVGDGKGGVSEETLTITYNPTPFSATPDTLPTIQSDSGGMAISDVDPFPMISMYVLGNDTDAEGDLLRVKSVSAGSPSGIITTHNHSSYIDVNGVGEGTATFTYEAEQLRYDCTISDYVLLPGTVTGSVTVSVDDISGPCSNC